MQKYGSRRVMKPDARNRAPHRHQHHLSRLSATGFRSECTTAVLEHSRPDAVRVASAATSPSAAAPRVARRTARPSPAQHKLSRAHIDWLVLSEQDGRARAPPPTDPARASSAATSPTAAAPCEYTCMSRFFYKRSAVTPSALGDPFLASLRALMGEDRRSIRAPGPHPRPPAQRH